MPCQMKKAKLNNLNPLLATIFQYLVIDSYNCKYERKIYN